MSNTSLVVRGPLHDAALIEKRHRRGELARVRHGVYIDARTWDAATREERMRLSAQALVAVTRGPVVAGLTAAAMWRLPLYAVDDERVHTIERGARPASSRTAVVRHKGELTASDIVVIDGVNATSLARTVYDVIRTESAETAIAVFDAALRRVAWRSVDRYDDVAAERLRADVIARIDAHPGARGVRQARLIATLADGRAQLPGESVSRLWMHRLGVEPPLLQIEVRIEGGRAFPDFAWPGLRRFGEFDGDGKYLDIRLTGGRSAGAVLESQRSREMAVIAATGWTPLRWGWRSLESLQTFEKFLRAQRVLPPAPPAPRP